MWVRGLGCICRRVAGTAPGIGMPGMGRGTPPMEESGAVGVLTEAKAGLMESKPGLDACAGGGTRDNA